MAEDGGIGASGQDQEEQRNSEWEVREDVTSPAPHTVPDSQPKQAAILYSESRHLCPRVGGVCISLPLLRYLWCHFFV